MKHIIGIFCLLISLASLGQSKSNFKLDVSYGLNGNYFVKGYDELGGPPNKTYLYSKNFIGTIAGIELIYKISNISDLSVGYLRSINKGKKQFIGNVNGVDLIIRDFNIRHVNNFYQLYYGRSFTKTHPAIRYHIGLFYSTMQQQEIGIENFANSIIVDERNFSNSKLEEGGAFAGIHFLKKIDTKFELGLRIRLYYLISTASLETITLAPSLVYNF